MKQTTGWSMTTVRATQRVYALCLVGLGATMLVPWTTHTPWAWLLLMPLAGVGGYGLLRPLGTPALVIVLGTLLTSFALGEEWVRVNPDGIAPPFPLYVIAMLTISTAASVRARWRWLLAVNIGYLALALLTGVPGDLSTTLDQIFTAGTTNAALLYLTDAIRRSAVTTDARQRLAHEAELAHRAAQARLEATEQARRLLHDEVIGALVSVERLGPTDPDAVRLSCARAAAALTADAPTDPSGGGWDLATLGERAGVAVEVRRAADFDPRALPPDVVEALLGAVAEALRNIKRHAGVGAATISLNGDAHRGVTLTVSDRGCGIPAGHHAGFGIEHSIHARLRAIGGTATLTSPATRPARSRPDAGDATEGGPGTEVRLHWRPEDTGSGAASDLAADAVRRTPREAYAVLFADAEGRLPHLLLMLAIAFLSGHLWALAHLIDQTPTGIAELTLGVAVAAGTLWWAPRLGARSIGGAEQSAGTLLQCGALAVGLWLAGPGALAGFESWIVGMVTASLAVVGMVLPWPRAMLSGVACSGVVLAAAVIDHTVPASSVASPIMQPLLFTGVGCLVGWTFTRSSAQAEEADRARLVATARSVADQERQRFLTDHATASSVAPFLSAVAAGDLDPAAPGVRRHAGALALEARDDLYLPGSLSDDHRTRLRELRAHGAGVSFRIDQSAETADPQVIDALLTLALPVAAPDRDIVITLPRQHAATAYITITGVIADTEWRMLAPDLDRVGATVLAESDFAEILVPGARIRHASPLQEIA